VRPLYCTFQPNPHMHTRAPTGRRLHHAAKNVFYFTFELQYETVT